MAKDDGLSDLGGPTAVDKTLDRRSYLAALGAAGVIGTAGCLGGDDDDDSGGNGNGNGNGNGQPGDADEFVDDATFTSFIGDPPSDFNWDILGFRNEWPREGYGYCLDMLAYHDENEELQPQAVADWGWDANEIWFELRDDLYWSDGEQITAEDVFLRHEWGLYNREFSPEEIEEEGGPDFAGDAITDVEIDGLTGRLISEPGWFENFFMEQYVENLLTHPTNGELYADSRLFGPAVEEAREIDDPWSEEGQEALQDIDDEHLGGRDLLEPEEIRTSGAWTISEVREDSVILEPNEYYRYYDDINFDEVELLVQTDENTTWSSLQGGILDNYPGLGAPPAPDIIDAFPDHVESYALDELAHTDEILVPNGEHEILGNVNVRRALMHAIDKEVVAENSHPYAASAPEDPIGLHAVGVKPWVDDDLYDSYETYEHDLDRAEQYLEEEGFTLEDGEWYTPDGDRFAFELLTASDSPNIERTVASQLSNFGIDVTLTSEEDTIVQERKDTGDFEVVTDTWVGTVQGKFYRGLQQSARRRMWGMFDEDQVQDWIDEHDNIEDVEYDWTYNIEGFEIEQTREFTLEAPPVGEFDSDEMVEYEVVYLDLLWEQNVDDETRQEIMEKLTWVYNWNLTMMPVALSHNIAFQNQRDWLAPTDDSDWINTGPGPTFSLMNRGLIQADPDGQH